MNGLALCSGYGGLELGIERFFHGYKTVCHVEGEAFAVQHLIKKMEEGRIHQAPIWDDLRTFDGSPWRGKVDIIAGGFPCQPFSAAGKRLGTEDERHLWPFIAGIIRQVRPRFLFFENVPGVVKWVLRELLLDIAEMGYDASWCVIRAADAGAPHIRSRWFCFATLRNPHGMGLKEHGSEEGSERVSDEWRENLARNGLENDGAGETSPHGPKTKRRRRNKEQSNPPKRQPDVKGLGVELPHTYGSRIQRPSGEHGPIEENQQGTGFIDQGDKWGGRFESCWTVEPSMGRLVDGAPDWVDKLRLLGNGVVPQQAHMALEILTNRLGLWGEEE